MTLQENRELNVVKGPVFYVQRPERFIPNTTAAVWQVLPCTRLHRGLLALYAKQTGGRTNGSQQCHISMRDQTALFVGMHKGSAKGQGCGEGKFHNLAISLSGVTVCEAWQRWAGE